MDNHDHPRVAGADRGVSISFGAYTTSSRATFVSQDVPHYVRCGAQASDVSAWSCDFLFLNGDVLLRPFEARGLGKGDLWNAGRMLWDEATLPGPSIKL